MKIIKNRKMKGTVLLTVVSIMTLMIIFMTTTLVLANAANKRAHRSYSSSQAEYTARAAIEAFTASMERDPGIVAAVQNMADGTTVHPAVAIGDSTGHSLGYVGYYDSTGNFVKDSIEVADTGKSSWVRADLDGTGEKWEQVKVVKISATARVGKEEKTVSAYIRKRGSNKNVSGSKVKGLNTTGNSKFPNGELVSGGLGLGLEKFEPGNYSMRNVMTLDTTLSFVNGSLDASTSTFRIVANKDESETVIMGDFNVKNDELINLKYTPSRTTYTQQNTPYFYVDGKLTCNDKFMVKTAADGVNRPYNVFAGSCTLNNNDSEIHADMYLLDPGVTSYLGQKNTSSSLFNWASSVMDGTTQFKSSGGSVYSRGNLELGSTIVNGDVRVDGDLKIICDPCDVKVYGDIICGGTVTFEGNKFTIASHNNGLPGGGRIYCNTIVNAPAGVATETFDNWKTSNGGASATAYPKDMTREAILGTRDPISGAITAAPPATKIIKTLDEVREGLNYDKLNGNFNNYIGAVSEFGPDAEDQTHYNTSADYITAASGTISDSCTITGFAGNVTIDASSHEVLVVLKGTTDATIYMGPTPEVIHNAINLGGNTITVTGNKGVKFFLDGNLLMDNGNIVYDVTYAKSALTWQEKIPIDFYGARSSLSGSDVVINSSIRMMNNCLIMGSFKMPWTDFDVKNQGNKQYSTYTSDTGAVYNNVKPTIVGNALFHDLIDTQNKFHMCYTEAGATSGGGGFTTALGYYDVDYFSGS